MNYVKQIDELNDMTAKSEVNEKVEMDTINAIIVLTKMSAETTMIEMHEMDEVTAMK